MSLLLPQLSPDPQAPFPPPEAALAEPDGLLAFGGDLSPQRLLNAYRNGIFPWYLDGEPILWWCPSERALFRTDGIQLPTRLRRRLGMSPWVVRADTAFDEVIAACASAPRAGQPGTWITPAMQRGYCQLHRLGHAHSIEVFDGARLVGGLYGVAVGRMFCGESMFSRADNASKIALAWLVAAIRHGGFALLDCQFMTDHLASLGALEIPQQEYVERLAAARGKPLYSLPESLASFSSLAESEIGGPSPGKLIAQSFTHTS